MSCSKITKQLRAIREKIKEDQRRSDVERERERAKQKSNEKAQAGAP